MKNIEKYIKNMKTFGIQMLIISVIVFVVSLFIDQFILTAGSGIMLFIGIDLIIKSNKLKKQQEKVEEFINLKNSPVMKVGTGYVAKGMDKLKD